MFGPRNSGVSAHERKSDGEFGKRSVAAQRRLISTQFDTRDVEAGAVVPAVVGEKQRQPAKAQHLRPLLLAIAQARTPPLPPIAPNLRLVQHLHLHSTPSAPAPGFLQHAAVPTRPTSVVL